MARRYGRSPRGQPCRAAVPHGHWKTSTFVAGLRHDAITAPMVIDGAMNSRRFRFYVRHLLTPSLSPGDVVVIDNLPAHKGRAIRELIEARGARLLYLPPYSPDLNQIELVFSKLKYLLRAAAPRTVDCLWTVLGQCLDRFTPGQCANYLRHCGYGQTV